MASGRLSVPKTRAAERSRCHGLFLGNTGKWIGRIFSSADIGAIPGAAQPGPRTFAAPGRNRFQRWRTKTASRRDRHRARIARTHHGRKYTEPDADEHRAGRADALGAVYQMRERRVVFAAALCALA